MENGKYKKIYSITDSGKAFFFDWLNSPFEGVNVKNPELVKIYFMGFSDKASRRANIEKYLSHMNERYILLESLCKESEKMDVSEENRDILFYQLATTRYGRDFMKFNVEWYKKLLKETEDLPI